MSLAGRAGIVVDRARPANGRAQDGVMADISSCPGVDAYRLRVAIAAIRPLIWRRPEMAVGTTVAGLHAIVQTAFGWSGEHLHRLA
jgi:hypothetical protein